MTERAIVATFFRSAAGVTRLFALTVIEDNEHRGGRVFRVRKEYDIDWSRGEGCYLFHYNGGGGGESVPVRGLFFTSGPVNVDREPSDWCDGRRTKRRDRTRRIRKRNPTRRMMRPPPHIDLRGCDSLLDWLERHNVQQDAVWCSECADAIRGDHLCKHTWWCSKNGWYSTPSERCGHEQEECDEDLF